jgi:hypothetical protein
LFGLTGLSIDSTTVKGRLLARECGEQKVDTILPYLRAGFETAQKEAAAKARDAKASWRTLTGETYGEKKAAAWKAEKPNYDPSKIEAGERQLAKVVQSIEDLNQSIGGIREARMNHARAVEKLSGLREKAGRYARIQNKLNCDEEDLKTWEVKVEQAKIDVKQSQRERLICPHCNGEVTMFGGHLSPWKKEAVWGTETEAASRLVEYEKAFLLLQKSVANDKRDLTEAGAAAEVIKEAEAAIGTVQSAEELEAKETRLSRLKEERKGIDAELSTLRDGEKKAKAADESTAKAHAAHEAVIAWAKIAEALAPDGIPGEMLAEALSPINERLAVTAEIAEWGQVVIDSGMRITYGGRDYALISESEKWRADAMIAEAVSRLSGVKLLVLDRFDVLDLAGRDDLLWWLSGLSTGGGIDTALLFGTLKALPASLPKTIAAHWVENGVIGQLKEVA